VFLVHEDLEQAIADGLIKLDPFDLNNASDYNLIRSASIDLGIGQEYAVYRDDPGVVGLTVPRRLEDVDESVWERKRMNTGTFVIKPLEFVLASVDRVIQVSDRHLLFVEGKSSVGRRALSVQNAGVVEPGFEGVLTLELFNAGPIPLILSLGELVCHVLVAETTRPTAWGYDRPELQSRYQYQTGVTPAKRSRTLVGASDFAYRDY
jgi:deoxycytidine triphosphate deaminase